MKKYQTKDGAYLGTASTAHGWSIAWWHEGEDGLYLGQEVPCADQETQTAQDAITAAGFAPGRDQSGAWVWGSKREATAALRVADVALLAEEADRPWPEWAKTAAANGWKPPRGWKP